jgi:hypothetical protein
MKPSELLSALCLIIVVLFPMSLMAIAYVRQQRKSEDRMQTLHLLEIKRVQTLLNLMVSKDFQIFASMQTYTQGILDPNQGKQSQQSQTHSTTSSDYIPRDDSTEAIRLQRLSGAFGVGEQLFVDDPGLAHNLSEMIASGQIDFGEGG